MKKVYTFIFIFFLALSTNAQRIKSVSPNSGSAGQTLNVTITGSNTSFTQGSEVLGGFDNLYFSSYFGGGSGTFYQGSSTTNYTVLNDTTIICNLFIPSNTLEGYYDIRTNNYGLRDAFFINNPTSPKILSLTPNTGTAGQTLNVTITGSNTSFTQGSGVLGGFDNLYFSSYFGGGSGTFYQGSSTTNYTVLSDTTIICNLFIPSNTIEGFYDLRTNNYGLRDAFYVNPRPSPLIKSVSPNATNSGTTLNVTINCSNTHFTQASSTAIEFSFDPVNAVNSYNVLNDSQLVANVTVPSNIYTDDYDVYVSNDIDGDLNLFDSFHITGSPCSINAGYSYTDNGNGNYSFNNSSTGNIVNVQWNFGDGTSSTGSSPSHTFTANGDYVVVLTVTDALSLYGYCYDYQAQLIHVTGVNSPLNCNAAFSVIPDTNLNKVYVFNCSIGNNLSYFWDFGDGNYSTNQYPNYTYTGVGPYYLCLTVNDGMGCSSTYCDSIGINGTVLKQSGFSIIVNEPTALGLDNSLDGSMNPILVTPNPSNGFYIVEIEDLKEAIPLSVYDLFGNLVYQKIIYSTKSSLDIRNLPSGVYFLKAGSLKPIRIIKK